MHISSRWALSISLFAICCIPAQAASLGVKRDDVQAFVNQLSNKHGFDAAELNAVLAQSNIKADILAAISKPVERTLDWQAYRKIFIQPARIEAGAQFMQANASELAKAETKYGVPREIITAVIGVETKFGRVMGSHRVIDALATLAFDYPRRAKFFRSELKHFLLLSREQGIDPLQPLGSYAGAMGYGQFMPSSYRHYAVDFDADGLADIWANKADAIGSVANYFAEHGWRRGATVRLTAEPNGRAIASSALNSSLKPKTVVKDLPGLGFKRPAGLELYDKVGLFEFKSAQGPIYLLGLHNFYVITRYNHSRLYALAVLELSEQIARQSARS